MAKAEVSQFPPQAKQQQHPDKIKRFLIQGSSCKTMSDFRQRQAAPEKQQQPSATPSKEKKKGRKNASSNASISLLDIVRVLGTLLVASCGLSYYVTSSESLLWGYRPWFTKWPLVMQYIVEFYPSPPVHYPKPDADAISNSVKNRRDHLI